MRLKREVTTQTVSAKYQDIGICRIESGRSGKVVWWYTYEQDRHMIEGRHNIPDISHLRVFGCGAYVHIPKEMCSNVLFPKSELMVYLGHTKGIKAYTFMRTTNNTLFTSTTILFDETLFPKCDTTCVRGTTHVRLPPASQSVMPAFSRVPIFVHMCTIGLPSCFFQTLHGICQYLDT